MAIRGGMYVPDEYRQHLLRIDIREEIIEAYGECLDKGRKPWDSWEGHDSIIDGFTPYDMSREIIKVGYNECNKGHDLNNFYGRDFARREIEDESRRPPADLKFQSLMWDLIKDEIFNKPELAQGTLQSFAAKDGYVEVLIEENWRVRKNSHRS